MNTIWIRRILAASAVILASTINDAKDSTNRYDPLPFIPLGTIGQALVDMEMVKHPEVKLIAIHVTLPGVPADAKKGRYMMFSSIGLIGKPDSAADLASFQRKKEQSHISRDVPPGTRYYDPTSHPKFGVGTPLLTTAGEVIGTIGIVFPYKEGDDVDKDLQIAHEIRDDFKARIPLKDDLYKPASDR